MEFPPPNSRLTGAEKKKPKTLFHKFLSNEKGNFAMLTGLLGPVLIMGTLYGTDAYYRTSHVEKFNEYVEKACYRALKITRTQTNDDTERASLAESLFNGAFPAEYKNVNTSVDVKMNNVTATVTAEFDPILNLFGSGPVAVQYTHDCEGIPPYPEDDTILFQHVRPEVTTFSNMRCWWGINPKHLGWDGGYVYSKFQKYIYKAYRNINGSKETNSDGSPKSSNTEAQWHGIGPNGKRSGCWNTPNTGDIFPKYSTETVDNEIALELDYYKNTEIYKELELHPGHYKLGFWYYPRNTYERETYVTKDRLQQLSNVIGGYITGIGSLSYIHSTLGCVSGPNRWGWRYVHFNFIVSTYGMYKIALRGDGLNDGGGGLINSMRLTYLNDLNTPYTYHNYLAEPEHKIESYDAYSKPNCTKWALDKWG